MCLVDYLVKARCSSVEGLFQVCFAQVSPSIILRKHLAKSLAMRSAISDLQERSAETGNLVELTPVDAGEANDLIAVAKLETPGKFYRGVVNPSLGGSWINPAGRFSGTT